MKKGMIFFVVVLVFGLWITALGRKNSHQMDSLEDLSHDTPSQVSTKYGINVDFGRMPVYFIANDGQMDDRVAYYITGKDKEIYFTRGGVTFVLMGSEKREEETLKRWIVKLDFVGADWDVCPEGEEKKEAVISYFKGGPEEWRAGISTYSRIVYENLWPGIDLVYYGTMERLKYEFIVHPGADPSKIRLAYRGASSVEVNEKGCLEVRTPMGGFEDVVPVGYQEVEGRKEEVEMSYVVEDVLGEGSELTEEGIEKRSFIYSFDLGDYDQTKPLVLDPAVLVYCGYLGGDDYDGGNSIAIDGFGNVYITGSTNSTEATFPVMTGLDTTHNGGDDAFVAKVNASGTTLLYCGYIGGWNADRGDGIAVDDSGNAYVVGRTGSTEDIFPVMVGPDISHNGSTDTFVAKVNASGTALLYCGYIGGGDSDGGNSIAVDDLGNAYVTGSTSSTETTFPVLGGPDLTHNAGEDAFVAKVNASGTALLYCGYIGGGDSEYGSSIAVDGSGNVYVTGLTRSTETTFPVMVGPDITQNGEPDAFVAKVNASGTALLYCGYIGGGSDDGGSSIAVDGLGNAYITGWTRSTETTFPVKVGPDTLSNGSIEAFVAKVNASGAALLYCGYIGGGSDDWGNSIAVDGLGNAYITGSTSSTETTFPVMVGPDITYNGSYIDAFVAKVNVSGTALLYCGYIGGGDWDSGEGIAVDGSGNAYITGWTASNETKFPVTVGPDLTYNNRGDAFVAKISALGESIRIVSWNILNYPDSNEKSREEYFRSVIESLSPDILVVQEMVSFAGVNQFLQDVLKPISKNYRAAKFFDGPDTDNALFYDKSKFKLQSRQQIPTSFRDIVEYSIKIKKGPGKGSKLKIYSVHFTEGLSPSDKKQRESEANALRTYLNGLPLNSLYLVCGTFNMTESNEKAFKILTDDQIDNIGRLKDPLDQPGKWHHKKKFKNIHTESTRKAKYGDGAGGGLNDRYDLILISYSLDQNGKLTYRPGSCVVCGNDGKHFKKAINKPQNKVVSPDMADALYKASDHLPVIIELVPPGNSK